MNAPLNAFSFSMFIGWVLEQSIIVWHCGTLASSKEAYQEKKNAEQNGILRTYIIHHKIIPEALVKLVLYAFLSVDKSFFQQMNPIQGSFCKHILLKFKALTKINILK